VNKLDELVYSITGQLNGYYNDRIYVGGSYGTNKALFTSLQINDIDVFILTPKRMCHWATKTILESIFDTVVCEEDKDYKIFTSYKRFTCLSLGVKFDLIFMNTDLEGLLDSTASDLSKTYHKYVGSVDSLVLCNEPRIQLAVLRLVFQKVCNIKPSICTDKHYNKIKARCDQLGLELHERS